MRASQPDEAWSVRVIEANGAYVQNVIRVPRSVAEAVVIGYLFDTNGGIGLEGTANPTGYPRIAVWSEGWT